MQTSLQTLDVRLEGQVLEVLLNTPDSLNAVSSQMHHEITSVFQEAAKDANVRAILLGANGRVFSAGGDFSLIEETRRHPERRAALAEDGRALFRALATCPRPVVAALQGDAIGLGATLALGCDAIVAHRKARLADPHVVIGLAAGDGGCVLWPQAMGLLRAKRYLLTGDRLSAEDAFAMGLVSDLVDDASQVLDAARALAQRIAALPPLAVQATKQALNLGVEARMAEVFEAALAAELDTMFSQDVGEAIMAVRERRPGRFNAR